MTVRAITIDPQTLTSTVTITGGDVFAATSGGSAIVFPQTISALTVWYTRDTTPTASRTVSITVGDVEIFAATVDCPAYVGVAANIDSGELTRMSSGPPAAEVVTYDNTTSELTAEDVQAALDEVVARIVVLETP